MNRRVPQIRAIRPLLLAAAMLLASPVLAQDARSQAAKDLQNAVQLFDEGDYVGAHHALKAVDPADLNDQDRTRHAEYAQRAALAVAMYEKAETDYDAAKSAADSGDTDQAKQLYRSVMDNRYGDIE